MKTAVIGLGSIGSTVAKNIAAGGGEVIIADRTFSKAEAAAQNLGNNAQAMTISDAIAKADILVLAVWLDVEKQLIEDNKSLLAGKIIIDPSNPIASDGNGGFKKTLPEKDSSGQLIAALLPGNAKLVKAFGSLSAQSLGDEANKSPERTVLFYAADDKPAGDAVAKLIETSGFAAVNIGGIDQSIRIEVGGDLHQMGGLGKPVTAKEAAAKI